MKLSQRCFVGVGLLVLNVAFSRALTTMDSVSLFAHASASRSDPSCLVSFFGSPQEAVLGVGAGKILASMNGGTSWKGLNTSQFTDLDACVVADVGASPGKNFITLVDSIPVGYLKTAQQGPWTSHGHRMLSTSETTGELEIRSSSKNITWNAAPYVLGLFAPASGGVTRVPGGLLATPWVWHSDVPIEDPGAHCCNGSLLAYVSEDNGITWNYRSTIASGQNFGGFQSLEGPNENDVVLLKDGKTIFCVLRRDGGDGVPTHVHSSYVFATSTDSGYTWKLVEAPSDLLSARPRATVLQPGGALAISGGRPGVSLWISPDGYGQTWQKHDIPTEHNALVSDPADKFCDEFLNANISLGWAQSSAYTQIVSLGGNKGLVCYERQGTVSGGFHHPLPVDCRVDGSDIFCMHFTVE
eukprot:m.247244 g.247244  ORF g.247244 m.247244 type:complete len:413 (+) comp19493_c0_seq1:117-1355(+)